MNDYTAETGNSRNLRRGAHQLLELYRGHWGQLFWAAFWFTVKHSPAWVTPIVIANIINIVTDSPLAQANCIRPIRADFRLHRAYGCGRYKLGHAA